MDSSYWCGHRITIVKQIFINLFSDSESGGQSQMLRARNHWGLQFQASSFLSPNKWVLEVAFVEPYPKRVGSLLLLLSFINLRVYNLTTSGNIRSPTSEQAAAFLNCQEMPMKAWQCQPLLSQLSSLLSAWLLSFSADPAIRAVCPTSQRNPAITPKCWMQPIKQTSSFQTVQPMKCCFFVCVHVYLSHFIYIISWLW